MDTLFFFYLFFSHETHTTHSSLHRSILNTATPHFIRCIKPNNLKVGRVFSAGMCNRQLACSGVYEAVRIRQQGPCFVFFFFFL